MPFRFGVVTLTAAPQAFVRAHIRLADGTRAEGVAAELMAPKWFDKNPNLSNEDNFEQLRYALRIGRGLYTDGGVDSAFGHFARHYQAQITRAIRPEQPVQLRAGTDRLPCSMRCAARWASLPRSDPQQPCRHPDRPRH
jgi:hypothetical protein